MKRTVVLSICLGLALIVATGLSSARMKPKPIRENPVTDMDKLIEYSEKLWKDPKLGKSGKSCSSCHPDGALLKPEPFPRFIKMTGDILTLEQMINFCMINPMKAEPLKWNSKELTALAMYIQRHTTK